MKGYFSEFLKFNESNAAPDVINRAESKGEGNERKKRNVAMSIEEKDNYFF